MKAWKTKHEGPLDHPGKPLPHQLLVEIPTLQERPLAPPIVKRVEHVGDVPPMQVGFDCFDDDGAGDGDLFADVAAAAGAFGGVAGRGVHAGEADALAADDFEAEVDVEEQGVGVDDVARLGLVEVARVGRAWELDCFAGVASA